MKNIPPKIKEVIKWVLVFTLLNAVFQAILFFSDRFFVNDIFSFLQPLFVQSLLFLTITLLTARWIHRKRYYLFFPIILFLLLSVVFLFNLQIENNKIVFLAGFPSFSTDCFNYNANIITDVLLHIKPLDGFFSCGIFRPDNTIYFYTVFSIMPFMYFLGLTCLCNYIINIIKKKRRK